MDMQPIRERYHLSPSAQFHKTQVGYTLRYEVPGRRTIPATFALFLMLLIILGVVAMHNMWHVEVTFETTIAVHGKKLQALDHLLRAIQERQLIVDNIIMSGDPYEKGHIPLIEDIKNHANELLKMSLDPQEQRLINAASAALSEIYLAQNKALEQVLMSKRDRAYQLIQQEIHPKIKEVYSQLLLFRKQQDYLAQVEYRNARASIHRAQKIFLILCAAAIVLGGTISFSVLQKVKAAFNGYYESLNNVYAELETSNYALNLENRERKRAEAQLRKHRDDLENRVAERTAELQQEIKIRAQTEFQLRISKEMAEQASQTLSLKNVELFQSLKSLRLSQQKVNERTQALQISNNNLQSEIQERQHIEQRLRETQQQMVDVAHRAGMSEIVTGVLHNVGNILNTVKTASDLISHEIEYSQLFSLLKANALLKSHQDHWAEFFATDPKGITLCSYYLAVGDRLTEERQHLQEQSTHLQNAVTMMSDIITAQQNYAKAGLLTEAVQLATLVEDALQLQLGSLSRQDIQIEKRFQPTVVVYVQKVKLLEVLINLLKNAKEAMQHNSHPKQLVLEILPQGDKVLLNITDNGEGIAPENLAKIFSHGFTTKETGHGFGLHASANAMAEMGGTLTASSLGIKKGATFTMACPTHPPQVDQSVIPG